MNHSIFIGDKMDMLQIPSTFTDLVGWFDSLNIEFKVLIAIIAILLSMVSIYIIFKLIEIFFLLLKVIFDGFLKIFRKSSKIINKIIISNEKSAPEENDSSNQERNEQYEGTNLIDSEEEGEEQITSKEESSITKNVDPIISSKNHEFAHEKSTNMIHCPNCGNNFSQNSYSKIGDTHFVSCEECGKRYISDGENFTENQ